MASAEMRRSSSWLLRRIALVTFDVVAWTIAICAGVALRYELDLHQIYAADVGPAAGLTAAAVLLVGTALQVYRGVHPLGTVGDAINVSAAMGLVGGALFVVNLLRIEPFVPRSVPLIATLIALLLGLGARLAVRLYRERISRPDRDSSQRVIVFGAGTDGQQLVRSMLSDPQSGYLPVAVLDDNPDLRGRRVSGVVVRGSKDDLAAVAAATRADLLVVAQREADAEVVRTMAAAAGEAGLGLKVLPPLTELLRPWVGHADLRDLDNTDLLGRRPVDIDVGAIAGYLTGRRVLVTGAGGSIGSELRRRAILLGAGADSPHLVRAMFENPHRRPLPVELLGANVPLLQHRFDGVPVYGAGADIETTAAKFRADLLRVIGPPPASVDRSGVDAAANAGLQVVHIGPLADVLPSAAMEDDLVADSAVAGLRPLRTRQRGKRTMDLLLCVLALPLVLSVCLFVAIVLAVGQGEVLYRARRVGRNGRPFTMLKFATMRPGDAGPRVTRERDPRITPIGRWLRATKLNELPQVFNVIKGDMSIVGPRPEDPRYAAFFTPTQSEVLQVRPGVVSLAYLEIGDEQTFIECADPADIEAYYVRELLPEKLRIELQYLQTWSIAGDLGIIARTAARLVNSSGGSHG